VNDWLNTLFPTGLAAVFLAAYKGVAEIRKGAHTKERGAIADLKRWREEQYDARRQADKERVQAEKERDYWRSFAGKCEYELERRGLPIPARPKADFVGDEEAT
jgi:hypothetical protein